MRQGTGFGYGKIILLGEHFVVHGQPALVTALPCKTIAQIKKTDQSVSFFYDQRPTISNFQEAKAKKYQQMLERIKTSLGINEAFEILLSGDLIVTSGGIGASAATAVAVVRALNLAYCLNLSDKDLYQAALHGEGAVHGTSSGIDIAAALYGDIFLFQKNIQTYEVSRVSMKFFFPLYLVVVDSGKVSDTQAVIAHVQALKAKKPHQLDEIFYAYQNLIEKACKVLQREDAFAFGHCMRQNQHLLSALGISCHELDALIAQAYALGALGAKLTGTGRGGLVLMLAPDVLVQQNLALFFEQRGHWVTTLCLR